jgi:hypothetical protein
VDLYNPMSMTVGSIDLYKLVTPFDNRARRRVIIQHRFGRLMTLSTSAMPIQSAIIDLCRSVPEQALEARRREFGISNCVLDRLVP